MADEIMTLRQLALYLNMSEASLYHLVAGRKIPGVKIGKQWRFSKLAIDRWLQCNATRESTTLVVDDDGPVLNTVSQALRNAGFSSTNATCVQEATALLQEMHFDILFLDVMLPDGTALDILKALPESGIRPEVVLITGFPEGEIVDKIRTVVPQVAVIDKPFRLSAILEAAGRLGGSRTKGATSHSKI